MSENFPTLAICLTITIPSLAYAWYARRTYKKQYHLVLKHRNNLEFALQSGRMGTWDIDLKNDRVSCSREMLDLWNVNPAQFKGERHIMQSRVHPDDLERMKKTIQESIDKGIIYECEYRIMRSPDDIRWVLSRGRCIVSSKSNKVERFAGIVYDITDRKLKEKALQEANETKERFFKIASHELRTPLTCLQLQFQVSRWNLKNSFPEAYNDERIKADLNKQDQHLRRIIRIADHILDESKISEGSFDLQFEIFDLCEMVKNLVDQFRVTTDSRGITLNVTCEDAKYCYGDRFRLEQVLLNLLMNAVRYGNQTPINVAVRQESGKIAIAVSDKGIGINPEDQNRIFQKFGRGSNAESLTSGLGLGLYISDNIIRSHQGEIKLKSVPGAGSEFTVLLPMMS